jgi:hypothetical protein
MKVTHQVGKMTVQLEGETQVDLFSQIASFQEVFGETSCGKCKSEKLRYLVRTNKDDDAFYELRCESCSAKLAYGLMKKGGAMYPKRSEGKGGDRKWLPDQGWMKWNKEKGCLE